MAGELKEAFDVTPEMEKLSGGVFEVYLNGQKIFSKKELGRFPESGEVVERITEVLKAEKS